MHLSPLTRAALVLAALGLTAVACGDDGGDGNDATGGATGAPPLGEAAAAVERPEVVFTVGGPTMDLPDEVPAGLVDIRIEAVGGQAHLAIARLNDDVTHEELETATADDALTRMATVVAGNGTIADGDVSQLTVDLDPGDYSVVNIYFPDPTGGPQFAFDRFVVDEPGAAPVATAEPEAEGTVTMGPGMVIDAPEGFDGTGTWRFENADETQLHEAALVRLADGATVDQLVEWFHAPAGPPPIAAELGSMGAIGPGREAWMDLPELDPGEYALVCFVPGSDGIPHLVNGMVFPFTVGAG